MCGDFFVTLVFFSVTVLSLPILILLFLGIRICRKIWLDLVSFLHPDVEFVRYYTVRSLLDTHRNQGIQCVLLTVTGQAQPDAVRRHLEEVVNRRDKLGNLAFPRLRHCLVARCGTYAWQHGKFDLDQHITVALGTYKGRTITEFNIQEYTSHITSKYLPSGAPPWQVLIIPSSETNHYILLKLHHLLLSEGMNIGDLLPLIPPARQNTGYIPSRSPLIDVFKKPTFIPQLCERLAEEISNRWNEFVATYDPLECPELLKTTPTFLQFLAISLLTSVALIKDCKKGFRVINNDAFSRIKYIIFSGLREANKRQVNVNNLCSSIVKSLNPKNVVRTYFQILWKIFVSIPLYFPIFIYAETKAFYTCILLDYCPYPHTFVGLVYTYIPLLYNSCREILYALSIVFSAPKTIIQDILLQKESLQTITLCGRKCVAWSDPIKLEHIKSVSTKTGVSETEIMLAGVSVCLSKYLNQTENHIPTNLPITIRNISSNYIFATGPNIRPEDALSGILCLNLAIPEPEEDFLNIENLLEIKTNFRSALEKQGLSHLLTLLQTKFRIMTNFLPSTVLGVYLKYLSRKYCVSVTEITSRYPNVYQRTLWGQEVTSMIYWRPPQANTSISLCFNEYGDHVKLGVMCDAQLVPHHTILVRGFPEFIKELDKKASLSHLC